MWYVPKGAYIGRYKAIKHKITHELCLSGKYGEIYLVSDNTIGVCIYSGRVANKIKPGHAADDELLIKDSLSNIEKYVDIIKLSKTMPAQVRYAESR